MANIRCVEYSQTLLALEDGREVELPYDDPCEDSVLQEILPNGEVVVGVLYQDADCESPMEGDGMGRIYSFSHRHNNYLNPASDECQAYLKEPSTVVLSYFEHGRCIWAPAGDLDHIPDAQWDMARYAGLWVPDQACIATIKKKALTAIASGLDVSEAEYARGLAAEICESYTDWCNGDCYGRCVWVYWDDLERLEGHDDECWGFIGGEYAQSELKEAFEDMCKRLKAAPEIELP